MVYFPFVLTFFLLFHISPLLTFHHDESPLLSLLTSSCNFFFCETAVSSSRMLASREPSKFARALAPRELRTDQQTEARQEFPGPLGLGWKPVHSASGFSHCYFLLHHAFWFAAYARTTNIQFTIKSTMLAPGCNTRELLGSRAQIT